MPASQVGSSHLYNSMVWTQMPSQYRFSWRLVLRIASKTVRRSNGGCPTRSSGRVIQVNPLSRFVVGVLGSTRVIGTSDLSGGIDPKPSTAQYMHNGGSMRSVLILVILLIGSMPLIGYTEDYPITFSSNSDQEAILLALVHDG